MVNHNEFDLICTDNDISMHYIGTLLFLFIGGIAAADIAILIPYAETIGKILFFSLLILWMIFKTDLGFKICYPGDINDTRCKQEDLNTLYFRFVLLLVIILMTVTTIIVTPVNISSIITANMLDLPSSGFFSIDYVAAFKEYGFSLIIAIISMIGATTVYKKIISTKIDYEHILREHHFYQD